MNKSCCPCPRAGLAKGQGESERRQNKKEEKSKRDKDNKINKDKDNKINK